ncbi:uncharacterized protein UTRI_02780 [Ustilago trichophora]|uniref:Effector family protein Eff1 n=1 Tax=Ustilago trichophora TaxID=86804 RepID=A0A5C3ENU7_9BASI|nr:uncharacterized protein UTRI_02780 [Ustilago trichophora]
MIGTPFLVVWLASLVAVSRQTGWKALYDLEPEAVAAILESGHSEAPTQLAGIEQRVEHITGSHSGPHTNAHTGSSSSKPFALQHTGWISPHTSVPPTFPNVEHGQFRHTNWGPHPMANFAVPRGEHGSHRKTIWGPPTMKDDQPSFDRLSEVTNADLYRRFGWRPLLPRVRPGHSYAEYGTGPYQYTDRNPQLADGQSAPSHAGQARQAYVNWSPQPATSQDMNPDTRDVHNLLSVSKRPSTIPPLQMQPVPALGYEQAETSSSFGLRLEAVIGHSQHLIDNGLLAPLSISEREAILAEVVDDLSARHTRMSFRSSPYNGHEVTSDMLKDIYPWGRYKFHKLNDYTFLSNHHTDAGFENTDIAGGMSGTQDASKRMYVWIRLSVKHQDAFVYRLVGLIETSGQAKTATGVLPSVGGVSWLDVREHGQDSVADSSRIREV